MKIPYGTHVWLVPSFIMHRNNLACQPPLIQQTHILQQRNKLCYHPAIKIGPYRTDMIIWSADYCCKTSKSTAIQLAADELARIRRGRCWPSYWRTPPGGDKDFLFAEEPSKVEQLGVHQIKLEKPLVLPKLRAKIAEQVYNELEKERMQEENPEETIDPEDVREAKRLGEGIANLLNRKQIEEIVESASDSLSAFDPSSLFPESKAEIGMRLEPARLERLAKLASKAKLAEIVKLAAQPPSPSSGPSSAPQTNSPPPQEKT